MRAKRATLLLFIPIIAAPIFGLLLFQHGWYMFWTCLLFYIVQLLFSSLFFGDDDNVKDVEIKVSDIEKYTGIERCFNIIFVALLVIIAVLDCYPYFAMSKSIMGLIFRYPRTWHLETPGSILTILLPIVMLVINAVFIYMLHEKSNYFLILKEYNKTGLTPDEKIQKDKDDLVAAETEKYGEGYQVISREKNLFLNERLQKLYMGGIGYDFKNILSFRIEELTKTKTTPTTTTVRTDNGEVLGRALLGHVIGGKAGAIIGGVTASRIIETTGGESYNLHYYNVYINMNDLNYPTKMLSLGQDYKLMSDLRSILTVIVNRNKG